MTSASGASGSGQHPNLGDLHRFVMDVAANRVGVPTTPSAFIGPDRPTSVYLGKKTIVAGPVSETTVRIMFRCVWEPGTQSRHVLIEMEPSLEEGTLALHLCRYFSLPTTGGITIEPVIRWMPGLRPHSEEMDKGKPTLLDLLNIAPPADYTLVLPFAEVARTLGSTLSGIVDLDVLICEEQLGNCHVCDNRLVYEAVLLRGARTWGVGESSMCEMCAQAIGFPRMDLRNGYIRVVPLNCQHRSQGL